jgi:hypothetical protein
VDCHATGIQPHRNCTSFRLRPHPVDQREGSGPTYHVTGTPVTTGKEPHHHLRRMSCLLDCGTSTATRGSPAHDPTVPIKSDSHGSVSRGGRHDGWHGQKWAGSNCSGRRAEAAAKSPAGSCPLLKRWEHPLPRREDDAPVSRSSNGSHAQRAPRESPVPSHQLPGGASDTSGRRGGRRFASAMMTASKKVRHLI